MHGKAFFILAVTGAIALPALAHAQNVPACAGLTGERRTQCLRAEVERGRQETARIERNNARVDRAKKVVCVATRSSAAGAIGGAIGDAALRQDRPCTPRAQ